MADPDCMTGTAELFHCSEADGEICSPTGACTVPAYSAKEPVVFSMPCHELLLPGDTKLHGYFGDHEECSPAQRAAAGVYMAFFYRPSR